MANKNNASELIISRFEEYFSLPTLKVEIEKHAANFPAKKSYELDWERLARFDPDLADELLEKPDSYLSAACEALSRSGLRTMDQKEYRPNIRPSNLPDGNKVMVLNLGASQLDKLVSVEGVVSSISEIKPRIVVAKWLCLRCGEISSSSPDKTSPVVAPTVCNCGKPNFKLLEQDSIFVNMQRSQMQDPVEKMKGNVPAVQMDLWLEDDLTNLIAPGDKVVLTGELRLRPVVQNRQKTSVYSKFFEVLHVHHMEVDFEEIEITKEEEELILNLKNDPKLFDKIVSSIAPSIYGHSQLKSAIALQLFGGTPGKIMSDGEKVRSDIHILMIGDPGTGKSTILEYVRFLSPKCVVVSGGSSTGVGITAAAERDELTEGWVLKAGAMVLANGGMVAIDEVDKMSEQDRGAMHQAMEQQRISVAKAGIVTEFQTRTSVLAAANPKMGRFDYNSPLPSQFLLSPALISRFDLIFAMKDVLNEDKDRKMAMHILSGHMMANRPTDSTYNSQISKDEPSVSDMAIDHILLRKYIAYARRNVFPQLTPKASEKIQEYYVQMRKTGMESKTFPVTARQIEGIIRLAEASAKLRMSNLVSEQDAVLAIKLLDFVLNEIFVDRETGKLDSDVINIGTSKNRQEKARTILSVLESLMKTSDLVLREELISELPKYGIEEANAKSLIDDLIKVGDIYSPKNGYLRAARPKD